MSPSLALHVFCEIQAQRLRVQLERPYVRATPRAVVPQRRRYIRLNRSPRGISVASPHGTVARYNHGKCRCEACRTAKLRYYHAYHGGQQQTGGTV